MSHFELYNLCSNCLWNEQINLQCPHLTLLVNWKLTACIGRASRRQVAVDICPWSVLGKWVLNKRTLDFTLYVSFVAPLRRGLFSPQWRIGRFASRPNVLVRSRRWRPLVCRRRSTFAQQFAAFRRQWTPPSPIFNFHRLTEAVSTAFVQSSKQQKQGGS